jgi:hypothetical protein
MTTRYFLGLSLGLSVLAAVTLATPALAQTWTITTIDATGDVGRYPDVQVDSSGDLHVVYLRNDNHTLKFISRVSGSWGSPEVIDASGFVDGPGALAVGQGGEGRVAYHRNDQGAAWFAGPEAVHDWSLQPVVQSGDVGRSASVLQLPTGEIGVAYRNQSAGALELVRREGGIWGMPVTVDPGPNRGQYFDLTYRSGVGYAFSEYAPNEGAVLLADPLLDDPPWVITPATSQADNVGTQLKLLPALDGGLVAAFKNVTRGSLQYVRREGGAWSSPVTVDPGPNRGEFFDIAEKVGIGLAFSEYDPGTGAALCLDPVLRTPSWTVRAATSHEDDLGRGLSVIPTADGVLGAAFRDETMGSLMHARFEDGSWSAPVTVDTGPSRGAFCDLTYDPAEGFLFSEYDGRDGAAMLAHSRLRARPWLATLVDPNPNAGQQASMFLGPTGRLECAYISKDAAGVQSLRVAEIVPESAYVIRSVADSVGTTSTGQVTPDVSVTGDLGWYVSYRNAIHEDLCVASTAEFQVLPADGPEDPQGGSAAVLSTRLAGAYPNPASSGFCVRYVADMACVATFTVHDPAGRLVRSIVIRCARGENELTFDGRNETGAPLAAGVYFLRMQIDGRDLGSRRVVLLGPGNSAR